MRQMRFKWNKALAHDWITLTEGGEQELAAFAADLKGSRRLKGV